MQLKTKQSRLHAHFSLLEKEGVAATSAVRQDGVML
jgi:hypothetical protein